MKHRELELLLDGLFEGGLGGEDLDRLQNELRVSPAARDAYREQVHLQNALQLRAEGIDLLRVVPMDRVIERRQRRLFRFSALAAAALLVIGAVVMALILTRRPPPTLEFAVSPGTGYSLSHLLTGDEVPEGQRLEPGSRLELAGGTVELNLASGVRGIVRGPADLTLLRADLIQMEKGTAWFEVPRAAVGFKVATPGLILTDLGTEFGIVSKPQFMEEVHVFKGRVEVISRHGLKQREIVGTGEARVADPVGRWKGTPLRRDPFLTALPEIEVQPRLRIAEESSGSRAAYAADVSTVDLLQGLKPEHHGWNLDNQSHPDELTDGVHGAGFEQIPGDKVQGGWTLVGATAEWKLGPGARGAGYDLTSIVSIADWENVGFGNQAWTLEVRPVGGGFRVLAEVACEPLDAQPLTGGGATKVTLTDAGGVLATGIDAIRITAGRVAGSLNNAFVWRELDVFGRPAAAPESRSGE